LDAPLATRLGIDSSLWTLLSDDDEDVRRGATDVICDALAEGKPLCHDRAVKIYWDHLCHFFAGTPEWYTWLWSKVCNSEIIGEQARPLPTFPTAPLTLLFKTNTSQPSAVLTKCYSRPSRLIFIVRITMTSREQRKFCECKEGILPKLSRRKHS
jgi:hypothetical protein